jgi:alginate O-acetyltransferase complex protein AlgI
MLFNSHEFLFLYLPLVLAAFFLVARASHRAAALWLGVASVAFYAWWNPRFVALLLASIAFNHVMGIAIGRARDRNAPIVGPGQLMGAAVVANLLLLGYFKYTNFFITIANRVAGTGWPIFDIVLPLGISFFTFTQIAFLVDVRRGTVREYSFVHYLLFVTYFPHLIAGPVLHHKEMMPQFARASTYRINAQNLSVGLTIFAIGLFKKVILADTLATFADPVFAAPGQQVAVSIYDAWLGALSYTCQLYFDFSGYSDMAIGLSRLFGVTLPLNFHSPYKAVSIIEFWRRWHMTLSRFLRDYLYIPLGGSRKGGVRRYVNLLITMVLGGLWHGAGATFVIWGAMHGAFLVINHGWQGLRRRMGGDPDAPLSIPAHALSVLLTFVAVVAGWVMFRSADRAIALTLLQAMAGAGSAVTGPSLIAADAAWWVAIALVIVWAAPNTQQLMADYEPALDVPRESPSVFRWSPTLPNAVVVWALMFWAIIHLGRRSAFLYFQF